MKCCLYSIAVLPVQCYTFMATDSVLTLNNNFDKTAEIGKEAKWIHKQTKIH